MKSYALFLAAVLASSAILAPPPVLAQANTREACMNQWLFNGVWRAEVTKIAPASSKPKVNELTPPR